MWFTRPLKCWNLTCLFVVNITFVCHHRSIVNPGYSNSVIIRSWVNSALSIWECGLPTRESQCFLLKSRILKLYHLVQSLHVANLISTTLNHTHNSAIALILAPSMQTKLVGFILGVLTSRENKWSFSRYKNKNKCPVVFTFLKNTPTHKRINTIGPTFE